MLEVCVHPCTVMGRMEIEVLGGEKKKKKNRNQIKTTTNVNPPKS